MFNIKHQNTIENAVKANHERTFYSQYPEHPKAYGENAAEQAEARYKDLLQKPYRQLLQTGESTWAGEEVSPFTQESLGITYPLWVGGDEVGELSKRLGNRGGVLPHTVVFDPRGKVVAAKVGAYKEAELDEILNRLAPNVGEKAGTST